MPMPPPLLLPASTGYTLCTRAGRLHKPLATHSAALLECAAPAGRSCLRKPGNSSAAALECQMLPSGATRLQSMYSPSMLPSTATCLKCPHSRCIAIEPRRLCSLCIGRASILQAGTLWMSLG